MPVTLVTSRGVPSAGRSAPSPPCRRRVPVIISHRHRFIFVKARKTAGTSVEIALSRHRGPEDVVAPISPEDEVLRAQHGGVPAQNYEPPRFPVPAFSHLGCRATRGAVGVETWDAYLTFAVERNPWDAVVSSYHYRYRDRPAIAFSDFVMSARADRLARNQRKIRIDGRVVVDHVCRFENLAEDLEAVYDRIGLPGPVCLPHAKSGFRTSRHYREYYGPQQRRRVARLFHRTIRDFGYEF